MSRYIDIAAASLAFSVGFLTVGNIEDLTLALV